MRLLTGIVVIAALAMCKGNNQAEDLATKLDSEFRRTVPVGATKADVIAFLTSHKIEFYDAPSMRMVTASIPDVQRNFMTKFGVYMKFVFDDSGRLESHEIRAVGTGP